MRVAEITKPVAEIPSNRATSAQPVAGISAGWLAAALLLCVVLAMPFFLVDVPPVLDYPNHLARYFVLAHPEDPVLSQIYAPHWGVLPNIGLDVIGAAMLRVTDVHVGGRLLLALTMFVPAIGVVLYHRAAFGGWHLWPLASGVIACNGVFLLGFMNFLLSLGLAFAGAAAWIALRRRGRELYAALAGTLAASAIFFCHIFGVALFALLIGAEEAARLRRDGSSGRAIAHSAALLLVALAPALLLYLVSPLAGSAALFGKWRGWFKLFAVISPFMTTSLALTLLSFVGVGAFLLLMRRRIVVASAFPLAMATLLLIFLTVPSAIKSGTFVDFRISMMIALLLFAGLQPRLPRRPATLAVAMFAALIALRSGYIAATWSAHRADLVQLRAAIAQVPAGAKVLVARGHPGHIVDLEHPRRSLPGMYRLDAHLAALLLIERRAFWPLLFAHPAQQPLVVRPAYADLAEPLTEPVEWADLQQQPVPAEALAGARYLRDWRNQFDDLLLIDPPAPLDPPPGLTPVYSGNYVMLFRIVRGAP